jgi:hypothetical protein
MKMTTGIIIGLIILVLIIVFFFRGIVKDNGSIQNSKVKETKAGDNPYKGLRDQAINVTPDQLQLNLENENEIYGILMDWHMDKAIVTVVSYKTGDASIYLSSGQGFIGGFAHETVVQAAKKFVTLGEEYFSKASKTESTEPAQERMVDFYFLTKGGKYYIEEQLDLIEKHKSDLTELFNAGNQVITEYRLITDNK